MDDRNQEQTGNQETTRIDDMGMDNQQEQKIDYSYYQPNFQASFTEPVSPERRQEDMNNNTSYGYSNTYQQPQNSQRDYSNPYNNPYYGGNDGGHYNSNGNPYEQMPPKKPKKRIGLIIGLGIFGAVFFGFGCYGVYDYFFVGNNHTSITSDNKTNQKENSNKGETNNKEDNEGALSEDNSSNNDVLIQQTPVTDVTGDNKVVTVSENTQPAIVAINSTVTAQNSWGQSYQQKGSGSGIIIKQTNTTLLIATNNHVVEGATNIDVVFVDGKSVSAKVKGTDSTSDLAVIEVQLKDVKADTLKQIKVATLGSSKELKVGEMVVAIGNALGYGQSVTVGYISAKDRVVTIDNNKMKLLQTDAAINPGNSGGALLNLNGEVIGINSAKFSSEEVEGMGYAIPISDAIPIINDLVDREVLKEEEKGYIGISGTTVTDEMHNSFNYPYGVYVSEVAAGGAAAKGGIKPYDIITKLNGTEITTIEGFKERLNSLRAGTEVSITVQRIEDGAYKEKTFKVTLQDQKVLNGLQSGDNSNDSGNNGSNGNDNNGGNTNPYSDDGSGDYSNPFSGDDWPFSIFE